MTDTQIPTTDLTTALAAFASYYSEHGESSLRTLCERGDALVAVLSPAVDALRTSWLGANGQRKPAGFNLAAFVSTANANGANLSETRSLRFGFALATCKHSDKSLAAYTAVRMDDDAHTMGPDDYADWLSDEWAPGYVTNSGRRSAAGVAHDTEVATAAREDERKRTLNTEAAKVLIDPESDRTTDVMKGKSGVEAVVALALAKHDFDVRYAQQRKVLSVPQRKQVDKLVAKAKAEAVKAQKSAASKAAKAAKSVS